MTILSLLQESLHIVSINKPYFGKATTTEGSVTIPPEHTQRFDVDTWASYVKKLLEKTNRTNKGKQKVHLILGQRFFTFVRIDIPVETPSSSVSEYIRHHLFESTLGISPQDSYLYETVTNRGTVYANVYVLSLQTRAQIQTLLDLFDMSVEKIYPEAPLLFSTFSHTLNKNKTEPVFFLEYGQYQSTGLMFDAQGLFDGQVRVLDSHTIIAELKKIVASKPKPARLIVSGKLSTEIRQDSFTKEVGMWTNPLHRILQDSQVQKKAATIQLQEHTLAYLREITLLHALDEKKELISFLPQTTKAYIPPAAPTVTSSPSGISPSAQPSGISPSAQPEPVAKPAPVAEDKPESVEPEPVPPAETSTPPATIVNPAPLDSSSARPASSPRWIVMTIVMLVTAGITLGIAYGVSNLSFSFAMPTLPFLVKPTPTPTPEPTATPTPTLAPVAREDITLSIENGVGTAGLAGTYQERLTDLGYEVASTGNADNYDYTVTIIKTGNRAIFELLKKDMASFLSGSPKYEKSTDSDSAVIILGSDSE